MAQIVNRKQAASHCGVSLPTFDVWIERGCPFVQRGSKGKQWQFDLDAVSAWRDYYVAKPNQVVVNGAATEFDTTEQAAVVSALGHLVKHVGRIVADVIMLAGGTIETAYAAEQLVTIKLAAVAEKHLEGCKIEPVDMIEMFCAREDDPDWEALAASAGQTFDGDACDRHMASLDDKWTTGG